MPREEKVNYVTTANFETENPGLWLVGVAVLVYYMHVAEYI